MEKLTSSAKNGILLKVFLKMANAKIPDKTETPNLKLFKKPLSNPSIFFRNRYKVFHQNKLVV